MKMSTGMGLAGIIAAVGVTAVVLTGCGSQAQIAATVNGENIEEATITEYIQNFREANALSEDTAWAQWLVDNSRDADSLRSDAIDYYVRVAVIEQDAKAKGITVSDEDIDSQLAEIKEYYGYDDEQFKEQIEAIGYTEDTYREYIRQSLTQEKLMDATSEDIQASDAEILEMANNYSSILNGAKKVRCIAISTDNSASAVDIQKQASAPGADFNAIADEKSESTDYDGWDVLVPMDQAVSDAIATLDKGAVSDVIQGTDWLFIVKVEDTCAVGDGGFTAIDQVPTELKDEFAENVVSSAKSTAFDTYVQNLIDSADKVVNPKPSGLPYDVSTEGIEPSSTSTDEGQTINVTDSDGNPIEVDTSGGTTEVTAEENANSNSNS